MNKLLVVALLFVGTINLMPLFGLFSSVQLQRAYGIVIADPNIEILLRHRALLFGIMGSFVLVSIGVTEWRMISLLFVGVSMASFLVLVVMFERSNSELLNIAYVDIAGLVVWLIAFVLVLDSTRAT